MKTCKKFQILHVEVTYEDTISFFAQKWKKNSASHKKLLFPGHLKMVPDKRLTNCRRFQCYVTFNGVK